MKKHRGFLEAEGRSQPTWLTLHAAQLFSSFLFAPQNKRHHKGLHDH